MKGNSVETDNCREVDQHLVDCVLQNYNYDDDDDDDEQDDDDYALKKNG